MEWTQVPAIVLLLRRCSHDFISIEEPNCKKGRTRDILRFRPSCSSVLWARPVVRLYTTRYSHRFLASYLLRSCCAGTRRADANRSNMTNTAKTLYIYRSSCGTIVVFTVLRRSRMASVLDGATARAARKFSDSPRRTIETTFVAPQRSACSNQSSARSWQGAPQPGTSTNSDLRPATSRGGGGGGARNSAAPGGGGALVPGGASAPTATSTGGTSSNVTRIVCCIAVSAPHPSCATQQQQHVQV